MSRWRGFTVWYVRFSHTRGTSYAPLQLFFSLVVVARSANTLSFTLEEVMGDVVLTGSGSFDTAIPASCTFSGSSTGGQLEPDAGVLFVGGASASGDYYNTLTYAGGPTTFGEHVLATSAQFLIARRHAKCIRRLLRHRLRVWTGHRHLQQTVSAHGIYYRSPGWHDRFRHTNTCDHRCHPCTGDLYVDRNVRHRRVRHYHAANLHWRVSGNDGMKNTVVEAARRSQLEANCCCSWRRSAMGQGGMSHKA